MRRSFQACKGYIGYIYRAKGCVGGSIVVRVLGSEYLVSSRLSLANLLRMPGASRLMHGERNSMHKLRQNPIDCIVQRCAAARNVMFQASISCGRANTFLSCSGSLTLWIQLPNSWLAGLHTKPC